MTAPAFTIVYWGTTGSLTAPLRPTEVTDKVVAAICELRNSGQLQQLLAAPQTDESVRQCVERLPYYLRCTYRGNTTCIEVQTDELMILDSGSGIRELGIELNRRWNAPGYAGDRRAHVLISHSHMDHTYGTPFVDPYYDPRCHFILWASKRVRESLDAVLHPDSQYSGIYFPPTFALMRGIREFKTVEPGEQIQIGETHIRTFALNHPGSCLGYRLERAGKSFVFASDHEHTEVPDRALAEFARGADVFYTDAQYLIEEYEGRVGIMGEPPMPRRGWGHSTIESFVATAAAAGVRRLHLGHLEPKRSDEDMHRVEEFARTLMRRTLVESGRSPDAIEVSIAREGMRVEI